LQEINLWAHIRNSDFSYRKISLTMSEIPLTALGADRNLEAMQFRVHHRHHHHHAHGAAAGMPEIAD